MFESLTAAGTVFRRGQLVLVSAGPGTGKSAFTLTLALRSGVTALYLSADSDAFEQLYRAICIRTGVDVDTAKAAVLANELGEFERGLSGVPVRFCYDASPSLDVLEASVEAYEELYGEYPALIVVDNVANVQVDYSEDGDGLRGLLQYLHTMARATGACVVGLHHVTGAFNDADRPIPMSGVKGQITDVPEMVVTLHKPEPGLLGVSTVKNRGGRQDPSGKTFVELAFGGDRMRIADLATPTNALGWREDPEPTGDDVWS